ncbi:helix-turn-helix domain-containing protein [Chryseobacterium rhizosphaerae]|uniref:helix-turn-helix domain-containing protein n=1 Tax=Chryseobacterium rhizosphaerae TaxID=395937 RepID=UPI00235907B1|nr:helix-turn-helix transcriptional regulator [Chryseobacterium rhizosphaerae]MDC8098604.1 helix-turn-helix domain-containing protein [Chryseobacterium rhizosphaerae]
MANILRIKEILKSKGMTINDLASIMEINRVTLSSMINGNPTLDTLQKIASYLKIDFIELFSSIKEDNYSVSQNAYDNHFNYDDENICLNGYLPHISQRDSGTFKLDVKRKDFSIIPNVLEIYKLTQIDHPIEEFIFKGNFQNEVLIQLFSSYTSLYFSEHKSFCDALNLYIHFHQQCKNEIEIILGVNGFKKYSFDSNYYQLGMIDKNTWLKLIKLTHMYDLDAKSKVFEKFNSNGYDLIMYNSNVQKGYNIKMWVSPIEELSTNDSIMLGWKSPYYTDRKLIISKDVFNAKESFDFINNVMIPMTKKV